jgi:DNA-binding transcriptional LysR family regulator
MLPTPDQLLALKTVVETGGITAAARRLGLAKSVISKRLADLEQIAGGELIRRTTRRAEPTDAGRAFAARAAAILTAMECAVEEAGGRNGSLRGPMRVAAPLTFGRMFLVEPIVAFARTNPGIELSLDCDDARADIAGGGYDLGIRVGRLNDSSLIARKIAAAPSVAVASPDYLARHGAPKAPADLTRHICIGYANIPSAHQWLFSPAGGGAEHSITVRPRLNVNNGETIREAVIAGYGIAVLPRFMVGDALRDKRLVPVLPRYRPPGGDIYALWPHAREPSRKTRALVDMLVGEVPRLMRAAGVL